MKRLIVAAIALSAAASPAAAQSAKDLENDQKNTNSILTYGMGYGQQRYSPLKQIDKSTVQNLVPVWNYSLASNRGQESHPIIHDGVMYLTTHESTVALNPLTGKQIWKTKVDYPAETPRVACCGIVNRGVAIYQGKLYRTTLDAHVVALDAKTGKVIWKQKAIDFRAGYSQTVTPLIANGVVVTGISGGEYGIRGFLDGWDPETGKRLWRRYTIPAKGEKGNETWPGDTWKHGGAPTWLTGTYDAKLDLVYWGTGNAGPWNPTVRKGDNLYTNSVLAIRPKTGEIVWHYQFSPNDPYDYDGVNELVMATLQVDGQDRDVIMQANRNGFFYILDRKTGKLLRANKFVKVTWADKIDMKSGRPVETAITASIRKGNKEEIWPSAFGGKNWSPMAFDPARRLAFVNTLNFGWTYKTVEPKLRVGTFYFGVEFAWVWPQGNRGYLKAIDPLTGNSKWQVGSGIPRMAGVLATGGGLVFTGRMTGEFEAFDADSGQKLWSFQTGSGTIGQPVTWTANGRQYITVLNGVGGVYSLFSGDKRLASVPAGGSVWTFALMPK
ncbi:MAG: PQQ-dependent dehydrogenase, methanol/ethanol family [Rhodospirillaceae bacterium]|nr:PQQ-dependent dehydrogenase, methanol/ethanol family [Rhodospirillaceae bacterium]